MKVVFIKFFQTGNNATFVRHKKVRTGQLIYSIYKNFYVFMCNDVEGSRPMWAKVDDNSRYFADRCSYESVPIPKKKALKILAKAPKAMPGE